jgi:hypothetical protein
MPHSIVLELSPMQLEHDIVLPDTPATSRTAIKDVEQDMTTAPAGNVTPNNEGDVKLEDLLDGDDEEFLTSGLIDSNIGDSPHATSLCVDHDSRFINVYLY